MYSENNTLDLASKHRQLFQDIQQHFNETSFTDVNLFGEDATSPLKCHILLLVASSDFLRSILSDFSYEDEVTIIIPDYSKDDLEIFLNLIYGNYPKDKFQSKSDIMKLLGVNFSLDENTRSRQSNIETLMTFNPAKNSNQVVDLKDMNIDYLNSAIINNIDGGKDITVLELDCEDRQVKVTDQRSCTQCLKTFSSLKKLQSHVTRVHENKNIFQCSECDQILASTNSLEIHMRSHTGHRPFSCEECEKSFTSLHYLTQHKEFHRKSKDYECDICFKRYQNNNALSQHKIDNHSNIKYQCGLCLKLFSAKRYLKEHEKKKHSSGGSSYNCDICGKTLSGKNELKIHSRIHTGEKPFHCEECNKHFRAKSTFTIHMKSHSGTKNAVCDECGKRFIQWGDLRKHMRTHTGERPFVCSACDRSFARKDYLLKHEKTHNKKKADVITGRRGEKSLEETLDQENVVINVSDLRSFVSESGDNIQVVRILGGEEDQPGSDLAEYPGQDSVMYVITN